MNIIPLGFIMILQFWMPTATHTNSNFQFDHKNGILLIMFQSRKDRHPGFGLTEHDKKNLNFMLGMNQDELTEWIAETPMEDLMYAREIAEINHVLNVDIAVEQVPNYFTAQTVLKKYMPVTKKTVAKQPIMRRLVEWFRRLRN
jgi:hypothetical protein